MPALARCRQCGNARVIPLTRLIFSPDGSRLVTPSLDGKLKLWDVASGQEVYTLRDTTGGVQGP